MKKRTILSSFLTIALCFSLIVGSTFALFTSEDTVNIAVSSATVEVTATINKDTVKLYSMEAEQSENFENGGTAEFDTEEGDLVLTNITPGDKVTFDIDLSKGESNVAIQYRLLWTVNNTFGDALVATADGAKIENSKTAWKAWTEETDTKLSVSIELPVDTDDTLQEKSIKISFKIEVAQANADMPDGLTTAADNSALYKAAAEINGDVSLISDITITGEEVGEQYSGSRAFAIFGGKSLTVDLNGHDLNYVAPYQNGNGYIYLYTVVSNAKLTIGGEGTVNVANSEGHACIVYAQGTGEIVINGGDFRVDKGLAVWAGGTSNITITGGSFISTGSAGDEDMVYSSGGVINIEGGFFHNKEWENRPLNVANANRNTGFIYISGGTFVNADPSTGFDDPNNILIVDGYKVVSETQENGDIWYTVVPE